MQLCNIKIDGKSTLGVVIGDYIVNTHQLNGPVLANTYEWIVAEEDTKAVLQQLVDKADPKALAGEGKAFKMIDIPILRFHYQA